jgi:hypothetical protein
MKTKLTFAIVVILGLITVSFGFTSRATKSTEVNKTQVSKTDTGFASERMF